MEVVFIHIKFPGNTGEIISKIFQFATPIFYMIAGYFAFNCTEATIKRRLVKIVKIFLWSFLCYFGYNLIIHLTNGDIILWLKYNFDCKAIIKIIAFCTVDYAYHLWYIIAMIETYLLWWLVVRKQKQDIMLKLIPILFATLIFLEVFCETNNYEWFWKINFATKALPYFLMGYLIKKNNEKILDKISFKSVIASGIVGLTIALVPVIFSTKIRFSMVGIIIYLVSLFIIAIKLPSQKKISGCVQLYLHCALNM